MLADCCREDPSRARGRTAFGSSLTTNDLPPGTVAMFACSKNEQAFEHDDWKHGAFTFALLQQIEKLSKSGKVTSGILADRMYDTVQSIVEEKTSGQSKQTLYALSSGRVDFLLKATSGIADLASKDNSKPPEKMATSKDTSEKTDVEKPEKMAIAPADRDIDKGSESNQPEVMPRGDWTMWGGSVQRNMVHGLTDIDISFDPITGKNKSWEAKLGSVTHGSPAVGNGKILIGTNNAAGYRQEVHPSNHDRGVLLCFEEKTGEFIWQLTREKLAIGRSADWPLQGICSTPVIDTENKRAYVVTNRCEILCLDMEGFKDGKNDGSYQSEKDKDSNDADIIWAIDMIDEFGVVPKFMSACSPVLVGDHLFVVTGNGTDETSLTIPSPRAPSFLCVDKNMGNVIWEDDSPGKEILHGQWASPAVGVVNGKPQVYMPGGRRLAICVRRSSQRSKTHLEI